ncbi:hypothetical protein FH972_024500 [Carpinus fangiana]|uniref:Uncharacterized protein n=1 Tax=Carpinus fangiana TaxID=176857 RepID=A0A5N6KYM6_9ROSI|nr:hypothetical protein FH972_024500 [Carpinus fangiana]
MTLQPTPTIRARQLWNLPIASDSSMLVESDCNPVRLPSGGVVALDPTRTVTLSRDALFLPQCTSDCASAINGSSTCIKDNREPFFESSTPLIYVVATATVIAWTLLIVLLITPRTFSIFSRNNRPRLLPGASILGALSGRSSMFATGSRPWLQKAAALSVAVSMTIATADTFKVAEFQYGTGQQSADQLRDDVTNSAEIRILRIVSDLFLWLAQVQTLIRLFPRHKEKLLIKWVGFILILADIIFSCLNSFWIGANITNSSSPKDAISALSYLFQLALSLLYATWVFYYAITKRRYAFYHDKMPNMCIIALLSCVSISIPVAFFIADILEAGIAGWGDYFRWVGAAAASIVVWEWVERIEAVEREEKKDGILGREIFDGDEMLDNTPSDSRGRRRSLRSPSTSSDSPSGPGVLANFRKYMKFSKRDRSRDVEATTLHLKEKANGHVSNGAPRQIAHAVDDTGHPASHAAGTDESFESPLPSQTPIDRSNAASAESTVYAVRYHPVSDTPPVPLNQYTTPTPVPTLANANPDELPDAPGRQSDVARGRTAQQVSTRASTQHHSTLQRPTDPSLSSRQRSSLHSVSYRHRQPFGRMGRLAMTTFRRSRRSPPLEVKNALSLDEVAAGGPISVSAVASSTGVLHPQRGGLFARFTGGAGDTSSRNSITGKDVGQMQPTVIPAPPRGQTWSPDEARHSPMDTIVSSGTPGVGPQAVRDSSSPVYLQGRPSGDRPSGGIDAAASAGQQASTTHVHHFGGGGGGSVDPRTSPSLTKLSSGSGSGSGKAKEPSDSEAGQGHGTGLG